MTTVTGVYLSGDAAVSGRLALEREGFVARVDGGKLEATGPPVPEEQAPPLDGMGLNAALQGSQPVRAREQEDVPSSWVSGETSVSVECSDEEEASRVVEIFRGTGAVNVPHQGALANG